MLEDYLNRLTVTGVECNPIREEMLVKPVVRLEKGEIEILVGDVKIALSNDMLKGIRAIDFVRKTEEIACELIEKAVNVLHNDGITRLVKDCLLDRKTFRYIEDMMSGYVNDRNWEEIQSPDYSEIASVVAAKILDELILINRWDDHPLPTSVVYANIGKMVEYLEKEWNA